ncbi:MAG: endolytic transglycosylase MltG [Steroidobacteraceae bacterium]
MTRRGVTAWLAVLFVLLAAAAVAFSYQVRLAAFTPGPATELQQVDVPQGASLRATLRLLEQRQLILSAQRLEWYLRCCRPEALGAGGIKAGRYRIVPGDRPLSILQQMVEGRVVMEQVTIVEGWTFAQMRQLLAKQPELLPEVRALSDEQVMAQLGAPGVHPEGRFAPDTYAYAPGVTSDLQVLRMAFEAQRRDLQQAWDTRQPDLPVASPDEALTLASIIEKETGLASERRRVAGVFINRLREGMRLQTDPTVIYGLGARYDGNIRKRDLTTDGPYNTYTRAGLPPTPIALPGRESIVAALNPEKTDALFFVAIGDGSGGHYFSATNAEHSRAVQRYLERLRTRSLAEAAAEVGLIP